MTFQDPLQERSSEKWFPCSSNFFIFHGDVPNPLANSPTSRRWELICLITSMLQYCFAIRLKRKGMGSPNFDPSSSFLKEIAFDSMAFSKIPRAFSKFWWPIASVKSKTVLILTSEVISSISESSMVCFSQHSKKLSPEHCQDHIDGLPPPPRNSLQPPQKAFFPFPLSYSSSRKLMPYLLIVGIQSLALPFRFLSDGSSRGLSSDHGVSNMCWKRALWYIPSTPLPSPPPCDLHRVQEQIDTEKTLEWFERSGRSPGCHALPHWRGAG